MTVGGRRLHWAFALAVAVTALVLAPSTGAAQRAGANVDIANFAFHPPTLRIGKGARITFVNSSKTAHTATRAGSFDTGRIKPGKSVTVHFAQKGTFAYHCKIHPFMKGKIVVD